MNKNPQKVNLTSSNLSAEKLAELYRILPEAFAENKIDFDKLRNVLGDSLVQGGDKFSFSWAGKGNAIKNVLVPSHLTLNPILGESIKWDESENLFIEGDNLEVLKLLQKAYFEKVKMIYIDPPYNTGGDFVYTDNFNAPLDNYLKQTGQRNSDGDSLTTNKETNGRYHSDWLSMMYPRLKLAWNLLREDGVIFVSIDDNEVHHLRMVMDEIFGEENFVESLIWKKRATPPNDRNIGRIHEYILCYAKSESVSLGLLERDQKSIERYSNPDKDPRGAWVASDLSANGKGGRLVQSCIYPIFNPQIKKEFMPSEGRCWLFNKTKMDKFIEEGRVVFRQSSGTPFLKRYLSEVRQGLTLPTILTEVGFSSNSAVEIDNIFERKGIFEYAKPTSLIKTLIKIGTDNEDIVLDFFAGCGTTAHSIFLQNQEDGGNRKFICVQLPESVATKSQAFKAGYKNIADIAKERIRRVINGYGENPKPIDTGFKVFKLVESNYPENNFALDPEKSPEENQREFVSYLHKVKQKKLFDKADDMGLVYENIVKEGLSLNSKVEKISIGKNSMYQVIDGDQKLLACLEGNLASETVKELTDKAHKDRIFICLESSLDDTTAANLALNLDLKTI
jgi:adenine-specific DNA-methyltransferase